MKIKFSKTPVLGAVQTPNYFLTRYVLTSIPVKNWLYILYRTNPAEHKRVWDEIQADANKERVVSNDLDISRKTFGDRTIALIAGVKITGTSPKSGRILGEFKYILVDDEFLLDTLRQEFGAKIKPGTTWEKIRTEGQIEKR